MWTVVPTIYKVFSPPHIYALIFNCRQLPCYWRYLHNSMLVILHSWCQIQRTSSSFRYMNSGAARIQCLYSSAYSILNIQLNVSALLLEICRYLPVCYTANLVPNTEHILRFTLCLLWSRAYTMQIQLRILRLQHSTEYTCAVIGDMPTFGCALYWKFGAIYSAHPLVYAMWTMVPAIYNVITVPHIQASIFNWTYLCCHWRYHDNTTRIVLQAWCQIQRISSSLHDVDYGPGHIQCIYSSEYSGFNIQLNVSALILEISRQFNDRYTAILVPNTAHVLRFTLCLLWSRSFTM
jgi:hypothetical protein